MKEKQHHKNSVILRLDRRIHISRRKSYGSCAFAQDDNGRGHENLQKGNALIYVLIAIVLFAALTMTMGRQGGSGEVGTLSDDRATLYATQLISNAAQVKSAVDQMLYSGIQPDDLDFTLPGEPDPGSKTITRVFHADGGGLIPPVLPKDAPGEAATTPKTEWYLGMVGNIDWTLSADPEVMLTAYNISRQICETINQKIIGSTDIPAIAGQLHRYLVPARFQGGANSDLEEADCPDCQDALSLCVSDSGGTVFAFYNIIVGR